MLEKIDLSLKLPKDEYKSLMSDMEVRLSALQRQAIAKKVPMIIVFEGVKGAGKGKLMNRLIQILDPRHFKVFNTTPPNEEQRYRPYLWRFWLQIPANGRTSLFDKSWYRRVLLDRVDHKSTKQDLQEDYHQFTDFERQLSAGGYLIVKFFIHISRKEQKRRLKALEDNPATSWRVEEEDWRRYKRYDKYVEAAEDMLK